MELGGSSEWHRHFDVGLTRGRGLDISIGSGLHAGLYGEGCAWRCCRSLTGKCQCLDLTGKRCSCTSCGPSSHLTIAMRFEFAGQIERHPSIRLLPSRCHPARVPRLCMVGTSMSVLDLHVAWCGKAVIGQPIYRWHLYARR